MRHKILVVGTIVSLVSVMSLAVFFSFFITAQQAINPLAALTAVAVAVIGIIWFKKTTS